MTYIPIIKLNTKICKLCKREFKNEKSLKDHIFNSNLNDKKHISYKKFLRELRFKNAKKKCPICGKKIFTKIGIHVNSLSDLNHSKFKKKQIQFFVKSLLKGYSALDIKDMKSRYTNYFGYKYVHKTLINKIGRKEYKEISKKIFSKKQKKYWSKFSKEKRKEMMKKVYESEWKKLSPEERRNHPWIKAGIKASLESSKKGSKNQKYAYYLLRKELSTSKLKYNYIIEKDWHIDIAIPNKNIFIEWDGRHHRVPIHGISYLNNRKNRDKIKNKIITENLGGLLIRVKDDGRENKNFVKKKVEEIKNIVCNKNIVYGEVIQI